MGGYSAYQSMQRAAASPIQTEADVMGKITHEIEAYKEKGGPEFVKALYRNVQLWNAFSADLLSTDNQLPDQLKASLVSLSIWVEKHTHKVVSGTADVAALIDVNRSVLKGLMTAGQTPNPQTAGAQATGPQTPGLQETAPAASAPAAPAAARTGARDRGATGKAWSWYRTVNRPSACSSRIIPDSSSRP